MLHSRTVQPEVTQLLDLVRVTPDGADRFRATTPVSEYDRVFGGVILAYATDAASRTVDDPGMAFHSLHAHFLRPFRGGADVEVEVERWRDGRSFCTRHVSLLQEGKRAATATASFHIDEPGDEYQLKMDADIPDPETLPPDEWHRPFDTRDAGPVLAEDGTYASTRRAWFRLPGPLPEDPSMHSTLLAYLSDMTGSSFRPLSLDQWGVHTDASIDHAMWVHRPVRVDEWLLYDLQAVVNRGGRSLVRGCLFDAEGRLCMTIAQELLIRPLA